jgi:hypothetical protein
MRKLSLTIAGILFLIVLANPATLDTWLGILSLRSALGMPAYQHSLTVAAIWVLDIWLVGVAIFVGATRQMPRQLYARSAAFNGMHLVAGILLMLAINPIWAGRYQGLRVGLPIMNLFWLMRAFQLGIVKAKEGSLAARMRGLGTATFATLAMLLVLEAIFMFVPKSSYNDNALASKVWFARYWQLTPLGFREDAALEVSDTTRGQLEFIGDSFLAGHGVKNPADRFSDLIQARAGDRWRIHNHGQNGADTNSEVYQLDSHDDSPKLVVLCWYVNDVEVIAKLYGFRTGNEGQRAPFPISGIHGSYFLNYLAHLFPSHVSGNNYLKFLQKAYSDPGFMKQYTWHLNTLQSFAHVMKARFAVVLFPMLNAVTESDFAIRPMRDYWAREGVPCLDLSPIYTHYEANALVVNGTDAHPNEFAHKLAADAIFTFLNVHHLLDD